MSTLIEPVKKAILKSLRLLWLLARIIIPVSVAVNFLEHYGIMEKIAVFFAPVMSFVGLPGEAAIILSLGFFANFYAALGVIVNTPLTTAQMTTVGLMMGICHELPVETIVCTHTGLKIPVSILLRLGTAL
ncbi:MAG TPA: nucleoside recognition domain-containing protein, partial [Bacillota bacterium]|nr:nucleoside recognition domain-containing protein [Bacillota bacterium]